MKKSVLIIGGGIAGLAVARELARQSVAVTVLEAKNRFGGRIHTIHDGNVPIELGAEFVHGKSRALFQTISEAGLSTQIVPERNRIFENGKFRRMKLWGLVEEIVGRVNPRKRDCSFADLLAGQTLKAPVLNQARHFIEGFDAADARRISARALLRAQRAAGRMEGSQQSRINEGYAALVHFFENEIKLRGGRLLKNTAARHIRWKTGRVEVDAQRGKQTERFAAETAVITLPLGIWKTGEVTIKPALLEKQEAVSGLEFGNAVRITFLFRNPFWNDGGFIHALNEPLPTWWNDPRGPILTGWAGGPKADALRTFSRVQLESLGLAILGRIFSQRAASLHQNLFGSHFWNWAQDPDIRGAYSYIPVNQLNLPGQLASPVADTLFFAGEATVADAQTGTVFGALESGLRAAREVMGVN